MLRIAKYMQACMHTAVLCREFFVLNLASYIQVSASLHLVYTNTIWSMEDGHYAAISGYLCRAQNSRSPSCIYEIPEICITKKLQKLQAGKRQAVLQGSDSRWIRPWLTCCEKKWKRHQSFSWLSPHCRRTQREGCYLRESRRETLLAKLSQEGLKLQVCFALNLQLFNSYKATHFTMHS